MTCVSPNLSRSFFVAFLICANGFVTNVQFGSYGVLVFSFKSHLNYLTAFCR